MYIKESLCGSRLRKLFLKDVLLIARVLAMFSIAFPLLEELSFIYTRDANFAFVVGVITDEDYVVLDRLTSFRLAATGLHVDLCTFGYNDDPRVKAPISFRSYDVVDSRGGNHSISSSFTSSCGVLLLQRQDKIHTT